MYYDISVNVAEAIPYRSHKEKFKLVSQELNKNRYVEVVDELKIIYSANKGGFKMERADYYGNFREELIQAITIVATTTNMTVNQCIDEALKILREEKEKYESKRISREI